MLSFLSPSLLWALPLALAPVVLHLIFMSRARKVPFSDLTLLRAAYARALPATRLRQWLILLLRCLALAALVAAFARPVLHRRAAAEGADAGLDVVLLLDTSWSMRAELRGRTRFERAADAGAALVGLLKSADRVAVAPFSDRLEEPLEWQRDLRGAEAALGRIHAGLRPSDAAPALEEAYRFLNDNARPKSRRVVVVLSDNARHLFRNMPRGGAEKLEGFDGDVSLLGLEWEPGAENGGIAEVKPSGDVGASSERPSLSVRGALYGSPRPAWGLSLFSRGRRVGQSSLDMEPGLGPSKGFRLPEEGGAEHWGRFELRKDGLPVDAVYYYSLRVQPKPKVLLLYGSPHYLEAGRGGYFLKKLLEEGESLPYRFELADYGRLGEIRLEDYGAVLLADFKLLPSRAASSLKRYVLRGGGLWLIAGTQSGPGSYGELEEVLPGVMDGARSPMGGGWRLRPVKGSIPRDEERPDFRWDEFELQNVRLSRSYPLRPREGASVWFRDSGGRPVMAAGVYGRGRILQWASALDIRWTNLALKPVFTAWIDTGLRHLTRYTGRVVWRTVKIGDPVVREWGPGEPAPAKVQVRAPGGRRTVLLVADRRLEYRETREPGIYFIRPLSGSEGAGEEVFAVNADRSGPEGELTPAERLPWRTMRPDSLREDFLRYIYGSEVRTWALALVLLLLLLEMFLARPRVVRTVTDRDQSPSVVEETA